MLNRLSAAAQAMPHPSREVLNSAYIEIPGEFGRYRFFYGNPVVCYYTNYHAKSTVRVVKADLKGRALAMYSAMEQPYDTRHQAYNGRPTSRQDSLWGRSQAPRKRDNRHR